MKMEKRAIKLKIVKKRMNQRQKRRPKKSLPKKPRRKNLSHLSSQYKSNLRRYLVLIVLKSKANPLSKRGRQQLPVVVVMGSLLLMLMLVLLSS